MQVTFAQCLIKPSMFNGMSAAAARQEAINLAADTLNGRWIKHPHTSVETLYDWPNANVDFVTQIIIIPIAEFENWSIING